LIGVKENIFFNHFDFWFSKIFLKTLKSKNIFILKVQMKNEKSKSKNRNVKLST